MKGKGITQERIVETAAELATERGYGNYTVRDLAVKLDVKAASLYNHITSMDEVNKEVGRLAAGRLNASLTEALGDKTRAEALEAVAKAFRTFVQENPQMYEAIVNLPTLNLDEELHAVAKESFAAFRRVARQYQISDEQATHFNRCFRSALHGFVTLHMAGYYTNNRVGIEDSYHFLVAGYIDWIERLERQPEPTQETHG